MSVSLEPVELRDIALAIRDQTWLDIRHVEHGTINRVRVKQLQIGREIDEIVVEQNWCVGDNDFDHGIDQHTFDAEDIRWLRPTGVELGEVVERLAAPPVQAISAYGALHVVDQIVRHVAFANAIKEADVRLPMGTGRPTYEALRPRQEAMWLAYEMTDLAPEDICAQHFGYRSGQPLITVAQKVDIALRRGLAFLHGEAPGAWVGRIKTHAGLLDRSLGGRYRRTTSSPGWQTFL